MKNRNKKTIVSIALAAAMVSSMVATTGFAVSAEEIPSTGTESAIPETEETENTDGSESEKTENEDVETGNTENEGTENGPEDDKTGENEGTGVSDGGTEENTGTEPNPDDSKNEDDKTDGENTEGDNTDNDETEDNKTPETGEDTEDESTDSDTEDEPVVDEAPIVIPSVSARPTTPLTVYVPRIPTDINKINFSDESGKQGTETIVSFVKRIENAKENSSFTLNAGNNNLIFKSNFIEKLIENKGTLNITYKDIKFVIKGSEFESVKVVNLEKIFRSAECQKLLKTAKTIEITSDANGELVLAGE